MGLGSTPANWCGWRLAWHGFAHVLRAFDHVEIPAADAVGLRCLPAAREIGDRPACRRTAGSRRNGGGAPRAIEEVRG
jgi:hypothetical protein